MARSRPNGFTLVELMITAIASTIIMLAIGTTLRSSHVFWYDTHQRLNRERDGAHLMYCINRVVKQGTSALVQNNGQSLKVFDRIGSTTIYLSNGTIYLQPEGDSAQILWENVDNIVFSINGQAVNMSLQLAPAAENRVHLSTTAMRN